MGGVCGCLGGDDDDDPVVLQPTPNTGTGGGGARDVALAQQLGGATKPLQPQSLAGVEERMKQSKKYRQGSIKKVYDLGNEIGSGGFATVVEATSKTNGDIFACKIVKLPKQNEDVLPDEMTREQVLREIEIASELNHANVVNLKEFYLGKKEAYLIMEKMDGGSMIEVLQARKTIDEDDAKTVFTQLLKGIDYLHQKLVIHRDVKLENLLIKVPGYLATAKITDFGLSKVVASTTATKLGTPQYVAPDVVKQTADNRYDKSVDMWSAGVALYVMLAGKQPFWDPDEMKMFDRIVAGDYKYDDAIWESITDSAKDLIDKLLEKDSEKRLTAPQALKHPWITGKHEELPVSSDVPPNSTK